MCKAYQMMILNSNVLSYYWEFVGLYDEKKLLFSSNSFQNTYGFKYTSFINVLLSASPGSIWYILLLLYFKKNLFVTYCTIILVIPCTLLHILYTTWKFLHYHHLLDTIYWKIWHLRNTRLLFIYRACKLFHM